MDAVTFPWRLLAAHGGSYKRDTGSSKKSVEHYGPLDLVFVWDMGEGWTALLMADDGRSGNLGPFPTAKEARDAADAEWPWWKGEGDPPAKAWWDV